MVERTDFGAFVRIGPMDAVLHLSQIAQDTMRVDVKAGTIHASKHHIPLRIGSQVIARVSVVSIDKDGSKVGLACNESNLGHEDWLKY